MSSRIKDFQIDFCYENDIPALKEFLRDHWRTDHVLAQDEKLLRWQHEDRSLGRLNFVLAKSALGQIEAVLGFIDDEVFRAGDGLSGRKVVWLAIWKVKQSLGSPGLGLRLRDWLLAQEKPLVMAAVGINPRTAPLYTLFGFQTGILQQYYMLNFVKKDFVLVRGQPRTNERLSPNRDIQDLIPVDATQLGDYGELWRKTPMQLPVKNHQYLLRRYVQHPYYQYEFLGVRSQHGVEALLVLRVAHALGKCAIRIVDIAGPPTALAGLSHHLQRLIQLHQAEYLDLFNYGSPEQCFLDAGLLPLQVDGDLVVPNYFEPFSQENVKIVIAFRCDGVGQYVAFKADGDMDRPNLLPEKDGIC